MKRLLLLLGVLCILGLFSGCEMLTTDNEVENPNNDRGSYVWWTNRLNEEEDASEVDGQFGREFSSDSNDEQPDAIQTDPTLPGMNRN